MSPTERDPLKIEEFERRLAAALRRILLEEQKQSRENDAGRKGAHYAGN